MKCAINQCPNESVGLMEWPDINMRVELCRSHANVVGAVENALSFGFREPEGSLDAAWAEAEAAAADLFGEPTYIVVAGPEPWPFSFSGTYRAECGLDIAVRAHASPVAALRALTAKLRESVTQRVTDAVDRVDQSGPE